MIRSTLALALLLATALPAAAVEPALPGDSMYQVEATLTDQRGATVDWNSLRGQPRVVSMFYANCHLMCPMIIESGKSLQKQLAKAGSGTIDVTMLSLDPARDTPQALAEVGATHRLDDAHWQLLRPRSSDVRTLASVLNIRYRAQPDGTFNHTSTLILLDPQGREIARDDVEGLHPDPAFVARVKDTLAAQP